MAIKVIPNQPIDLKYEESESCVSIGHDNCVLYGEQDGKINTQFQLLPCAENVGVKELNPLLDDWIELSANKYQHISGVGATNLLVKYFTSSYNYISVEFKVTNMSTGVFDYWLDGTYVSTISSNGIYKFYSNTSGADAEIQFLPYINFDGTIEIISVDCFVIPLLTDWIFVRDIKGDIVTAYDECTTQIIENNYVTIQIDPSCLGDGCYKLEVCDNCVELLPTEKTLNWISQDWTIVNVGTTYAPTINLNYNQIEITSTGIIGNDIQYDFISDDFVLNNTGCCHKIKIPIISAPDAEYQIKIKVNEECEDGIYENLNSGDTIEYICCTAFTNLTFGFAYNETTSDQHTWIFGRPEVIPMADCNPNINCYTSNCFQILPYNELQETRLIEGECNLYSHQMGFYWTNNFSLKQRLRLIKYAPSYEIESKDYVFSNGDKYTTSAQKSKFYDFVFGNVSELQHDVLSTQILCKKFTISNVEYFVKPDDYKPEWSKSTAYPLADIRLQGMKQGTIIFRENQN